MVRMMLMPKSIEPQFLKRVHAMSPNDKQILADVLRLPNHDLVQVALCNDGGSRVTPTSVSDGLRELYKILGIRAEVNVQLFSFVSHNIAQEHETLRAAHIFWFAGVHTIPERLRQALSRSNDETDVNDLAAHVRRKVQYDNMP